jgi:hypothetical protein
MPDESGSAPVDARFASGQISRFFGIVIAMHGEQEPSHFHARYGEHEALIEIDTLDYVEGWLPKRAYALVLEWAAQHRSELRASWELTRRGVPPAPIVELE